MATYPPLFKQAWAADSKLSQSLLAIARCRAIFLRVFAPRIALIRVHIVPPVHGMEANNKILRILESGMQLRAIFL